MTLRQLLEAVQRCHLVLEPHELTVPVEPYLMLKNLIDHGFDKELDETFSEDQMIDPWFDVEYDCAEGGALYFYFKIRPSQDQPLDVSDVLPGSC